MAVPASPNAASFSDIQTAFGGSNPISLNEYYAGGGLTRTGTGVHTPNGIPTSGAISVDDFRGGNNFFESWSTTITEANATELLGTNSRGYAESYQYLGSTVAQQGSMSDLTPDQGAMNGIFTIEQAKVVPISTKGQPTIHRYTLRCKNGGTLANTDLDAFKTFTVNGRISVARSAADGYINSGGVAQWHWDDSSNSVYPPAASSRTFTLTCA
jgi:hypothetical protein